jgi:hypothetical protein
VCPVDFSGASLAALRYALKLAEEWLSDLRMEIGATDSLDYREALKGKESPMRDVLERLAASVTVSSSRWLPPGPARKAGPGSRS